MDSFFILHLIPRKIGYGSPTLFAKRKGEFIDKQGYMLINHLIFKLAGVSLHILA